MYVLNVCTTYMCRDILMCGKHRLGGKSQNQAPTHANVFLANTRNAKRVLRLTFR